MIVDQIKKISLYIYPFFIETAVYGYDKLVCKKIILLVGKMQKKKDTNKKQKKIINETMRLN